MSAMTPERIAVRAPNWLGDVVLSLSAIRDIRRAYPNARISVVARASVAPLYEAVPQVDAVVEVKGLTQEIGAYRRGFDLAILLPNSIGTALATALAGVPQRWGYATEGRGFLLTRRASVAPAIQGRSQVHYYRAMLAAMGVSTHDAVDTSIDPPAAWRDAGRALIGPGRFFGVAPGAAKGSAKQWPPDHFARAADRLSQELSGRAVLLGAQADSGAADQVARLMKTPSLNLCGKTDLRVLVGVMSCLDALVANDSGAMHLGAAVGVPTVGIFGPTNPDETHPVGKKAAFVRGVAECSPCRHAICPIDHRCMTSVTSVVVVEALLREVRS